MAAPLATVSVRAWRRVATAVLSRSAPRRRGVHLHRAAARVSGSACRSPRSPPTPSPATARLLHTATAAAAGAAPPTDEEVIAQLVDGRLKPHRLEAFLGNDCKRAARLRRVLLTTRDGHMGEAFEALPLDAVDEGFYNQVDGANCEQVVGFVPVPVGVVGPLLLDGSPYHVPMATTEGALLASTNRGCRAITAAGGAASHVTKNGMTRAPILRVGSMAEGAALQAWVEAPANLERVRAAFDATTRFGRLQHVNVHLAGKNAFVRFVCFTGDAMGMNMVTKGAMAALGVIAEAFPSARLVSLSGNLCSDKKAAGVNWIEGRGRTVGVDVVLPRGVVRDVLKAAPEDMVQLNINKNLVGSALAASLGGFNAHASNIVSAAFLATGNDIAQNIESSGCLTTLEMDGEDLYAAVNMPSIELGTVGGGTGLAAQRACLAMMGCAGASRDTPGAHADRLSRILATTVLAGELSLMAALCTNDLLKAHLDLNRKK